MASRKSGQEAVLLTKADRDLLRARRAEAVAAAYPEMTPAHVERAISDWYRGKPYSARWHRAIKKAGLL